MKRAIGLAAIAFSALTLLHAADEALPDVLPPGAKIVLGFRLKTLAAALDANGFGGEMRQGATALSGQIAIPGFDPLHDIDEVIVASESEGQNAPSLLVLSGRFASVAAAASGKLYKDVPVIDAPHGQILAVLSPDTALAGDRAMVQAAIDRRGSGAKIPSALAARIAPLRERYDIWGAGERSPKAAVAASAKAGANEQFQSIDRFAFGASLSHGLDATAEFHAAAPKDVQQMQQWLGLFEAMIKNGQKGNSGTQFQVQSNGGNFKLSITIPEEEWKKALQVQRVSLEQALAARLGTKPPAPAPTPERILTDDKGNTVSVTLPGKQ